MQCCTICGGKSNEALDKWTLAGTTCYYSINKKNIQTYLYVPLYWISYTHISIILGKVWKTIEDEIFTPKCVIG